MEINEFRNAIEAVLFASGEPVSAAKLAEIIGTDESNIIRIADDLMNETNMRSGGVKIVRLEKEYQMCTRPKYADYIRTALEIRRNTPLSQAALEVLSVVAYNQPVTRAFIEQVRGVECGSVIQGLVTKGLVEEKGRLELPGRPLLYGTTPIFLRAFGLSSLDNLPNLPDDNMVETTLDEIIEANELAESAGTFESDELADNNFTDTFITE